jgi:hypothetical protein
MRIIVGAVLETGTRGADCARSTSPINGTRGRGHCRSGDVILNAN